ncbi:MAG: UDP-N-acetylglucosamine 1-carboxyvinyltransferase [Kosmotogaceae bacterium]
MSHIVIDGGKQLKGKIRASGSKNAALPILAATVLIDDKVILKNVPDLKDVHTMLSILQHVGKQVSFSENTVIVDSGKLLIGSIPYELVGKMRASFNLLGPLTVACGWAKVGKPGGCNIGHRPIDYHIDGLKAMGFHIFEEHGDIHSKMSENSAKKIRYELPFPSVGTTEQLMTSAAFFPGMELELTNVAREPEIEDLQNFLNNAGGNIAGAGTDKIKVIGSHKKSGIEYEIISDRIEACTYLLAGIGARGEVTVEGSFARYSKVFLKKLEEMGVDVRAEEECVKVSIKGEIRPIKISAKPYPGFPTDLQPIITAVLSTAEGDSQVEELVFENRFGYVDELNRMGARIKVHDRTAYITGVEKLSGARVSAPDIRAAAALLVAALSAEGESIIENTSHIFRGYENLREKFRSLGAKLEIYPDE